uniref:Uncharacterized protein n=1 Tax=Euplotes crassus TaxID=5936 RepID=A0A7S3KUQ9_EUPCR
MAPVYGVGVSIGATLKLDMNILNGEGGNMLSVIPKVKGLQLEKFDFITPKGSPSDSDTPGCLTKSSLTSHADPAGLSNIINFETPRINPKGLLAYLNKLIPMFLDQLVLPTVEIPQREFLPLQVTNSELDFHKGYSELGLLFKFTGY